MNHKGYVGVVRIGLDEEVLRSRIINTQDMITFQGKTFAEAKQAFRDSVDDYLEFCESLGRPRSDRFPGHSS